MMCQLCWSLRGNISVHPPVTRLYVQVARHRCYSIMPVVEGEPLLAKHADFCAVYSRLHDRHKT